MKVTLERLPDVRRKYKVLLQSDKEENSKFGKFRTISKELMAKGQRTISGFL